MDKNTIIAVVLSTLVIIGSTIIMQKRNPAMFAPQTAETPASEEVSTEVTDLNNASVSELAAADLEAGETVSESVEEQTITINTDKAEIVLTNKGGDIISYKLKDFNDKDTNEGVQISDSVHEKNRTLGVSFGSADKPIMNETMNVEMIDDKTVLFKKNVTVKKNGELKTFTFGKKYSFKDGENVFKLDLMFHANEDLSFLNSDGVSYSLRSAPQIGPHFNPKENRYENRQMISYNGRKMKRQILGQNDFRAWNKQNDYIWTAIAGKYFAEIMIPTNPSSVGTAYYSSLIEKDNYANAQTIIERNAMSGTDISDSYYMYFGPRDEKSLARYNSPKKDNGEIANGWGIGGYRLTEVLQSSGWLKWLEKILQICLEWIQKVVKNWGVAIIILTILLKAVMFPMSKKQSMSTLIMQDMQPKVQAVQEKYKNDQKKQQVEMQKLYQEAGYNPMSGCLPMVFQFLVLFAMYNLFNYKFEFRGAMFIPGWIEDLSSGDSVWNMPFTVPFLGWTQLRLLPIIYTVTQLFYGKITQYGGQAQTQQNGMNMKFMMYGMPIIFFFLFYNAPSGLLIYWTVSNLIQMIQQIVINKMMAAKKAEMAAAKKAGTNQKTLPPKNKRK
ncbi:MAG: membrane protein insertase YidC [Treponema sp.]|nr:membrane protein insertase YidC [Treponema sp.]